MFNIIKKYINRYKPVSEERINDFIDNVSSRTDTELCDFLVVITVWNKDTAKLDWELPYLIEEMKRRKADLSLVDEYIKSVKKGSPDKSVLSRLRLSMLE